MSGEARWFAAYCRSRHESRVADHLAARNVQFFLPQYKSERRWSDRTIELMLPLFPGYIFVRIPIEQRLRVLESPGVLYLVGAGGRPEALEDAEIAQLQAGSSPQHDPRPHEYIFCRGDHVVVTQGPLQGYTGVLVREPQGNRVVLAMDLIQKAMSVHVEAGAIAPATRF